MKFTQSDVKRFWLRVHIRGPKSCWLSDWWLGGKGRPYFNIDGKNIVAARFVFLLTHGHLPKKGLACHSCDNKKCLNPAHIYDGDYKDNMRDMMIRGRHPNTKKTHCPKGHEYNSQNTILSPGKFRSHRRCRICERKRESNRKR